MSEAPGVVIAGASGRMGRMLIETLHETPALRLVGALERPGHSWIGKDVSDVIATSAHGVTVSDDPIEAIAAAQVLIDFTSPEATVEYATLTAQARSVHVVGTTGLQPSHLKSLGAAARHAVIVRAGNMSLGVNLLTKLTRQVAAALDVEFDIEVVEMHHRHKVDAPSGTALMLGEAAAEGRQIELGSATESGRDGITGARETGAIGFSAVRGGDVVGEHDVIFAGLGERVILRHVATDRRIFARGAIKAALWGLGRKPGEYSMMDVLGLD